MVPRGPSTGAMLPSKLPAARTQSILCRTGVRVAEGAGLENRYTGNGIEGSNPSLSVLPRESRLRSRFQVRSLPCPQGLGAPHGPLERSRGSPSGG